MGSKRFTNGGRTDNADKGGFSRSTWGDGRTYAELADYWSGQVRAMLSHLADPSMPEWSRDAAAENAATFAWRSAHYAGMADPYAPADVAVGGSPYLPKGSR